MALYRKYRPATFAEVVGQEHVTGPLSNALNAGRINHAYLFSGPRGCGKTSSARILARSLNCVQGPTSAPCGVCASCIALAPGGPGNLDVTELDAASHGGVDDARELRDRGFYAPAESRYRIFIIDEAHMVTPQGFNALLKIVEEPPEHLIFIFATTEPEKVLTTIRSRTHHYPFRLLPPPVMRPLLESICASENVAVEPSVYPLVIRAGGGSPRDSLSILDQLLAGAGPEGVTYPRAQALLGVTDSALLDAAIEALTASSGAGLFGVVQAVIDAGHDPRRFTTDLLERFRDLILLNTVPDAATRGMIDAPADQLAVLTTQVAGLGLATVTRYAELAHTALAEMRGTTSPRLLLEVLCARMLLPAASASDAALLQRLDALEAGKPVGPSAGQGAGSQASAQQNPAQQNPMHQATGAAAAAAVGSPGAGVTPALADGVSTAPAPESRFQRPSQRRTEEPAPKPSATLAPPWDTAPLAAAPGTVPADGPTSSPDAHVAADADASPRVSTPGSDASGDVEATLPAESVNSRRDRSDFEAEVSPVPEPDVAAEIPAPAVIPTPAAIPTARATEPASARANDEAPTPEVVRAPDVTPERDDSPEPEPEPEYRGEPEFFDEPPLEEPEFDPEPPEFLDAAVPPVEEPAAPEPPVEPVLSIDEAKRRWPEVLRAAGNIARRVPPMLADATPIAVVGGEIRVAHKLEMLARRFDEPELAGALNLAVVEVFGPGISARVRAGNVGVPAEAEATRAPAAPTKRAVYQRPSRAANGESAPAEPEPGEPEPEPEPVVPVSQDEMIKQLASEPATSVAAIDPEAAAIALLESELGAQRID